MADLETARAHLLSALEHLLRAASEALAALRERTGEGQREPGDAGRRPAGADPLAALADQVGTWLSRGENHTLDSLRAALRSEEVRWGLRAGEDRAAQRLHELFGALADVLEAPAPAEAEPHRPRAARRRAPSRRG